MTDKELIDEMIKRAEEFAEKEKREFVIEELEKIETEIKKFEYVDYICILALPASDVYDIIENRIKELKGEK